ncbi:MAG: hypothetical protein LW721_04795 [Flammeovirgaceae bacterium]|nr:hypothetical protein [Flammeovirgaceae bacterium]
MHLTYRSRGGALCLNIYFVSASVAGGYRSGSGLALGHSWFRFFPAVLGRFVSGSSGLSVQFQSSLFRGLFFRGKWGYELNVGSNTPNLQLSLKIVGHKNMVIALVNGQRLRAEQAGSGTVGVCPWTRLNVKAKVGEIRQYWAYEGGQPNLPEGYEIESEWHYNWKFPVKDEHCEVVCGQNNEHRADVIGNNETVIEIQKSAIDIRVVRERTNFYRDLSNKRVIWLVNATDYWQTRLKVQFDKRNGKNYPIEWKPVRQWVIEIARTSSTNLFLDYNPKSDKLLQMWIHDKKLMGSFVTKIDFFKRYYFANAKDEFKINPNKVLELWQ